MAIKLYKKLFLANSIYYGHNYINCMEYEYDDETLKNYVNNEFEADSFLKNYMEEKSYNEKESIDNGEQYFIVNKNNNISDKSPDNINYNRNNNVINNKKTKEIQIGDRIQKKLKYFNITKQKKRGRRKKLDKNNSSEDKVIHDKFEKKNIIDKIIRKYNCFLQLYLNSILKKNKVKGFFQKFKTISGKKFDVIKEFLDSCVVKTIAEENKRCKNKKNESLCTRIMNRKKEKYNEIKSILNRKNSDIYANIFLGNEVVKLKNEKEISYKSILNSIKDEYGDKYRDKFNDYAKDLIKTIDNITTRTSIKNKTQIKNEDYIEINSDYNKNEGLGEDFSNLNLIEYKRRSERKELDKNNLLEKEVLCTIDEKKYLMDIIIRKYNYFLIKYLNAVLKKDEIIYNKLNIIPTSCKLIQFDKIRELLESKVLYTVISEGKDYEKKNERIIDALKKKNVEKFNEIKNILDMKNSDFYKNIFLENHVVELENGEKISYKSILNSIIEENGFVYRDKFDDCAKNIMKILYETKTTTSKEQKLQIENVDNENNTQIKFLGKKTGGKSNLLLESQK